MTTLQNRPNTALLVIDVQAGVVAGNHERDSVVANVATLVDKARDEHIPVVWVQHNDARATRSCRSTTSRPQCAAKRRYR